MVKPTMGLCIALAPERITPLDGSGSPPEEERPADGRSQETRIRISPGLPILPFESRYFSYKVAQNEPACYPACSCQISRGSLENWWDTN